jgi:hypothetical protein
MKVREYPINHRQRADSLVYLREKGSLGRSQFRIQQFRRMIIQQIPNTFDANVR